MSEALIIGLMVVIAMGAMFVIPQWLTKRAIPQVIRIFREHNAIGINNAKTLDELGMRPRGIMGQMFKRRDYKQYALTALMHTGIIQMTEDGRLYLSEEKLIESGLDRPTPYFR